MKIQLLSIGSKMPSWVVSGFETYQKRFSAPWRLDLIEIPLVKRPKQVDINKLKAQEAQALLKRIPQNHRVIALDEKGQTFTSNKLATKLKQFQIDSRPLSIIIGGPDGLDQSIKTHADETWSLSALTLAHPLVRIVIAETLYRATTILTGHPYHR